MRPTAAALATTLALVACAPVTVAPQCNFSDFDAAPYDHIIEQLSPVSLFQFEGRLTVNSSHVEDGRWPPGLDARIELHGPDGFREFIATTDSGTFARPDLRPGPYCFKLSASGFRSAMGTVIIDPSAQPRPLLIELVLAD